MTTIELDRSALAQGVMDATADLREHTLHDVLGGYAALAASIYRDGYSAVLHQAELVAWDLFIASRPAMAGRPALTHSRSMAA